MQLTAKLAEKGLIHPPQWLPDNIHYETMVGSIAYGVSGDTSDVDVYGFCIPPKTVVFPNLAGEIVGFGRQVKRFWQYQEHHIFDQDAWAGRGKEYDITIYSIVKYFQLCMENNPNMIDSLYTPQDCVLHITKIGQMVRDNRDLFLHKGAFHKFRGYSYSQLSKMSNGTEKSKRHKTIQGYGYNLKKAYHIVRLVCEIDQILEHGTIDLRRDADMLKSIRNGEWSEQRVRNWFTREEARLSRLYKSSPLRHEPDESAIKTLLISCLEEHYGSVSDAIVIPNRETDLIRDIEKVLERYRK